MDALARKRKITLFAILILVGIGGILYGFDLGVISGALLFMERSVILTTPQVEIIVGAVFAGGLIGTIIAGPIADKWGRRVVVALSSIVFIVGILCVILAHGFYALLVGRIFIGMGVGLVAVAVPLYAVEIAPTRMRGRAVTAFQLFLTVGLVLAYFIDLLFTPSGDWRGMFAVVLLPAVILLLGTLFLPESPRFLVSVNKEAAARKVLLSTRNAKEAERDLKEIHESFKHSAATWRDLFSRRLLFPLFIAGSIAFCQQMTGINSFLQYAPLMLKNAGMSSNMITMLGSAGIGVVNMIMTMVSMALVDRVGRKPLLLTGLIGVIIAETYLGVIQYIPMAPELKGVLSLLGLIAFIFMFALGPGVVVWLAISELFPTRVRGKGLALCLFFNSLASTLVASVFLTLSDTIGIGGVYFLGALFTCGYFLVAKFCLPETNARSLEEIQAALHTA